MSGLDRVSTYATFLTTLGNISRVDSELANLQNQLSSGYKSQNFAGISENSRQFMQLEDRLARSDRYQANISMVRTRVETTSTILGQMIDSANTLKIMISNRRNEALDDGASFTPRLEALWRTVVAQMNTEVDGRYIFSGSRTDTKPVEDSAFPTLTDPSELSDAYYHGDDSSLNVRVADNVEIQYNVRANDTGIQKIFAAIALAKQGDTADSDVLLEQAYEYVLEGIQGVISAQAFTNSNTVTLNNEETNIVALKTYWKGVKEDIANTDIISASTQVSLNQGILQSAFQASAKIWSLRLVDFLR